jgi:hypothetical protein
VEPAGRPRPHAVPAAAPAEAHTAPHDEIVSVIRELVDTSPGRRVSIDALANVLKSRGFRRPPGSPRLMTRLRRIREIVVSPSGVITLAEAGREAPRREPHAGEAWAPELPETEEIAVGADLDGAGPGADELAAGAPAVPGRGRRRRRRRRRGGHRPSAPSPPSA